MGSMLKNVTRMVSDYRYIVSGNYMAFYRVYNETVYIVRILYGRRDYMRVLFDDPAANNISQ
jgi:plasmid stabilization system protein ParE